MERRLAQRSEDLRVISAQLALQQERFTLLQSRSRSLSGLFSLSIEAFGSVIFRWLERLRHRRRFKRSLRGDYRYLKNAGLVAADWYLEQYPDVARAGHDPMWHYLRWGAAEGRNPNPYFDTRWYLARYEDVAGSSHNPLVHYLRWGAIEGRDPGPNFSTSHYRWLWPDLVESGVNPLAHYLAHLERSIGLTTGGASVYAGVYPSQVEVVAQRAESAVIAARAAFEDLRHIDSDLDLAMTANQVDRLFLTTGNLHGRAASAWKALYGSLSQTYEYMIFVPWMVLGGSDRVAVNVLRAAIERYGPDSTLLVVADTHSMAARHWLPEAAHVRVLSEIDPQLSLEDRTEIVTLLIHSLQPRAVMNINSHALWASTARYGRALSRSTEIYAALFCRDYAPDGRSAGLADQFFRACLEHLQAIYFDNAGFIEDLCRQYGVPQTLRQRLRVLYQPVDPAASFARRACDEKAPFRVLWMARICAQKNPQLLTRIARLLPEMQFDVYGDGDDVHVSALRATIPDNVRLLGPARSFEQVPLEDYGAFLYTSLWDGLPIVLLQAGAHGLPIIAPALGGIPELIDETTGWAVACYREPEGFVAALRAVRDDPEATSQRVARMRERVETRHSWANFTESLRGGRSFLEQDGAG